MNSCLPLMIATGLLVSRYEDPVYETVRSRPSVDIPKKTKRELEIENSRIALRELFGEKTETYTFGWSDPRSVYK